MRRRSDNPDLIQQVTTKTEKTTPPVTSSAKQDPVVKAVEELGTAVTRTRSRSAVVQEPDRSMAEIAEAVENDLKSKPKTEDWVSQPPIKSDRLESVENALKSALISEKADGAKSQVILKSLDCELELSVGPETFSPIKYNTFTVGPVKARFKANPGESAEDLYLRATEIVHALYRAEFKVALGRYFGHLIESVAAAEKERKAIP